MKRLLAFVRAPLTRWAFLGIALALAAYAVYANWDQILDAASRLSWADLALATVVSILYVWLTLLAWRRVLADLGSPLDLRVSTSLFGLSQIGKYVPGGVWNVVAAAELGADHAIPRRRSVTGMAVSILISLVSGVLVGGLALAIGPSDALGPWRWVVWMTPALVVLLIPSVMNRFVALALKLARRPGLEKPLSSRGILAATAWSLAAWLVAGLQVWVLATALGMPATPRTYALAAGGYALAWVVGFLVVIVPAGAGAREAVLIAALSGLLPSGPVILTVLLSRAFLTVVDLGFAGVGALFAGARTRALDRPAGDGARD